MGSFTDFTENAVLNYVFGATSYTPSGTYYVGLSYTSLNDDGTNISEVTGTGYERVSIANDKTTWSTSSTGGLQNDIAVTFPPATGNWGTVVAAFIADQQTTGNIIAYGDLTQSKAVDDGDTAQFAIGAIVITLD